ncbi:recombinase family protein [Salmonella enterica subsp. enterica serovar Dublin]|nr:recombinase family protein [Salmonella enterica subsp. enterica serovar Dublin]ECA3672114.1 recombinase family protein [Salmonella enterica subsp. enterica serovar Dublin]
MALYGYARVSTSDQDLTLQTQILRAAGCEIIRAEKASGSGRTGRSELQLLLEFLRPGDTLMVTRVDRLARSIKDLQDIVYALNQQGVTLRATEQPVDTRSAAGKAFLDMLGVFAEFETNLRRERQMEGIAAAKARGVYRGRKPGTVAKLAMRQPFVLFKGLTFQKLCLPGAFRPGDHHNKMLRPGLCVVHASPQYL